MSTLELENIKHPDNSGNNIELNSNGSMVVDRQSTDGTIIDFRKSGTTVGTIGVDNGDNLTISGNSHAGLNFSDNDINPYKNGAYADGIIDLGYTTSRFKDLHLSGGIYVGGQSSANYLDDYETGSYTPTFLSTTGANPTVTYAQQLGTYTKVGNLITCFQRMRTSAVSGGSGNILLGGLPFNCHANSDETGGSIGLMINISGATGYSAIQVDSSLNAVFLMKNDLNSAYPVSALGANTYLRCTFQYLIE